MQKNQMKMNEREVGWQNWFPFQKPNTVHTSIGGELWIKYTPLELDLCHG